MDIVAKQWKQQLQYLLDGKDYESLIYSSAEDIPILPFYTAENVKSPYPIDIQTQVAIPLFVSDKEQTLKRITFWQSQSVDFFLLTLHPSLTQEEVKQWLPTHLHYTFTDSFSIDTTAYQNAGATMVQQIALGVAQMQEVLNTSKVNTVFIKIAIGSTFLLEIAKLRAFRRLLTEQAPTLPLCFIGEVSNRGLSLLKSSYNENYVQLAYEAAVLGGVDELLPKNPLFFKKNSVNIEKANVAVIQHITATRKANMLNGMYAIEALSYEMYKKALVLYQQVQKQGGLSVMLKNHNLQKQIKGKAQQEQLLFNKQSTTFFSKDTLVETYPRKEWDFYPFAKNHTADSLAPKRLWEPFEKSIKQESYEQK
ncbi:hypothetical protein RCZ04_12440 [Capnocytophaga sp. HP1101]